MSNKVNVLNTLYRLKIKHLLKHYDFSTIIKLIKKKKIIKTDGFMTSFVLTKGELRTKKVVTNYSNHYLV